MWCTRINDYSVYLSAFKSRSQPKVYFPRKKTNKTKKLSQKQQERWKERTKQRKQERTKSKRTEERETETQIQIDKSIEVD